MSEMALEIELATKSSDQEFKEALGADMRRIQKEFQIAKERMWHKVNAYFRQPVSGNYTTPDDLRMLIDACEKLHNDYVTVRDLLLSVSTPSKAVFKQ